MSARFAVRNQTRGTVLGDRIAQADGAWARLVGLLGRAGLEAGEGLLFPGTNNLHMMGMRFPVDVVFLGEERDGRAVVTDLRESLAPWTGVVWWSRGAHSALELPAGTIATSGTRRGDILAREG